MNIKLYIYTQSLTAIFILNVILNIIIQMLNECELCKILLIGRHACDYDPRS